MNDFIDLPHLPECLLGLPLETIHEIHSHTYHAIKADRQRMGEPGNGCECNQGQSCQVCDPVVKDSLTVPEGWQLVPKEPTQEMFYTCEHIFDHGNSGESPFEFFDRKYKDILEAAPIFGEEE